MTARVLVLRPEPGASRTAALLGQAGMEPVVYPLFDVEALAWEPPDADAFDALLLTSANAVRHAGPALARYGALPCYCVGEATAAAARDAGLADVRVGGGDAATTVPLLLADGRSRVLHLGGSDVRSFDSLGMHIERVAVYRAVEHGDADGLVAVVRATRPVAAMVHSPRAGERLAALLPAPHRNGIALIAISDAAASACGPGWRDMIAACDRSDAAMIAAAQKLACSSD